MLGCSYAPEMGSSFDYEATEKGIKEKGTSKQQAIFRDAADFHSAIREFWLSNGAQDMPLLADLKKGLYLAAICHANAGASDYNSANDTECPSIIVARDFSKLLSKENHTPSPESKKTLNDLLYLYKKLKTNGTHYYVLGKDGKAREAIDEKTLKLAMVNHPAYTKPGLNLELIAAYEKAHPEEKISDILKQMDTLIAVPETKRFLAPSGQHQNKTTLLGRLFKRSGR